MFSLDGFFANILAELVGIFGGIALTLLVVNWWLERRERVRWRPIQVIALKRIEELAEVLVALRAAARGEEYERHPPLTLHPYEGDLIVGSNFGGLAEECFTAVWMDAQWARAVRETAKAISEDLLRYPVVATRLPSLMVDLEKLQAAAVRWEEYATYVADHGVDARLVAEGMALALDGSTASMSALDLAASCVEQARELRRDQWRPSFVRRAWIRARRAVRIVTGTRWRRGAPHE